MVFGVVIGQKCTPSAHTEVLSVSRRCTLLTYNNPKTRRRVNYTKGIKQKMSFKPKQWDQLMTHKRIMEIYNISRRQLKICVTLAENQAALKESLPQTRQVLIIVD